MKIQPIIFSANEREATTIPLSAVLHDGQLLISPHIQGHGYFDIRYNRNGLFITAGRFIGLIPLNDRVIIRVEPKVPVNNVIEILFRGEGTANVLPSTQRAYQTINLNPSTILDAMAGAFADLLIRCIEDGLPKTYIRNIETSSSPRGAIDIPRTLQRHWSHGKKHLADCTYFMLSADVHSNRALRYACYILLRSGLLRKRETVLLQKLEEFFSDNGISLKLPALQFSETELPGQSHFYKRAVQLARAIIEGQGVDWPVGREDLVLPSITIDMEKLFEKYMRSTLARGLPEFAILDGNYEGQKSLFDNPATPMASPDIVIANGARLAIVEVKYKATESREDLNQVIAYCLSFRVTLAFILLPAQGQPAQINPILIGQLNGISIFRYRFNLANPDLDDEQLKLIHSIRLAIRDIDL